LDEAPLVAAVQPDDDLGLVLFSTNRTIELCERKYLVAPITNALRRFRFRSLLRRFDCVTFEVARLECRFLASSGSAAAPPALTFIATIRASPRARARTSPSPTTAHARPARTARLALLRIAGSAEHLRLRTVIFDNRQRRRHRWWWRRVLVHLGLDHDALDAAEKSALLDDDAMREFVALHAERGRGVIERVLEILSFEAVSHRVPAQSLFNSAG